MKATRHILAVAGLLAALGVGPAAAAADQTSFTSAGEHAFAVPIGVTSVQVLLVGGHGGAGSAGSTNQAKGGPGATVKATLAVSPGGTLYAQVAGNGKQSGAAGYGGGGVGGPVLALLAGTPGGGGGGGASAVRGCPGASCSPLVVAAGGGGGGAGLDTTPTITGGNGGASDLAGSDGEPDLSKKDAGGVGGKAATQNAGGGAGANSFVAQSTAGQLAVGGNGGSSIGGGGGGGGGGLFGGGGGGGGNGFADFNALQFFSAAGGGGGGGASGVPAGAAGVSSFSLIPGTAGAQPSVTFSWEPPAPATSPEAPTAVTETTTTPSSTPAAAPLVSGLRLSSSRFRRGTQRARLARVKAGTTVMFGLSAAAVVRLTFERAAPGRIAGDRCVRPTRARNHGKRCTRFKRVRGAVRLTAPAGDDRIRFDGVLDGGRRLAASAYKLSLVALDAAGQASPAVHARFRIIR